MTFKTQLELSRLASGWKPPERGRTDEVRLQEAFNRFRRHIKETIRRYKKQG